METGYIRPQELENITKCINSITQTVANNTDLQEKQCQLK